MTSSPTHTEHPIVPVSVATPGLGQDLRAIKVVLQRELIRLRRTPGGVRM